MNTKHQFAFRIPRSALCWLPALAGCMPEGGILIRPAPTDRRLEETTLMADSAWSSAKLALIDVDGLLINATDSSIFGSGEHPVSLLLEQLDKARKDARVKGVLLRINSPGGTVTASELMYQEIQHFKATTGKPVYAVVTDLAASGGYYVACACDRIFAQPSSITGSIGVIMQTFDLTGTMNKLGITADAITSGENKAAGSPFQKMTPEQRALFQAMINDMYEKFLAVVKKGRPNLTEDRIRQLADGRVYTATQALDNGLIDGITSLRGALNELKSKTGQTSTQVVAYHRPLGYRPNYYAEMPQSLPDINLLKLDAGSVASWTTPSFMYLWAP